VVRLADACKYMTICPPLRSGPLSSKRGETGNSSSLSPPSLDITSICLDSSILTRCAFINRLGCMNHDFVNHYRRGRSIRGRFTKKLIRRTVGERQYDQNIRIQFLITDGNQDPKDQFQQMCREGRQQLDIPTQMANPACPPHSTITVDKVTAAVPDWSTIDEGSIGAIAIRNTLPVFGDIEANP
jgi:hypothetical protein